MKDKFHISDFSSACGIALTKEDLIITGGSGKNQLKKASLYGMDGWIRDLPDMKYRRKFHACGYIFNSDKNRVNKKTI